MKYKTKSGKVFDIIIKEAKKTGKKAIEKAKENAKKQAKEKPADKEYSISEMWEKEIF